ncbi:MAG: hypothetical protein C4532_03325 [Candidatus Abyssobacteria bacterium SURF_17]|uniref:Glycosyltransferase RgtA/B/C/D-like domain-containing protein n=1 Tax=Candidatus Abyssobacteria bacterium SURF_17 TaxID=2093361 RepID=A0A419F6E0_9BACT|nr:MAG: hypothetical protein C4532_03325 [Candidatus Abyssubacteria bacterium SURF_17]
MRKLHIFYFAALPIIVFVVFKNALSFCEMGDPIYWLHSYEFAFIRLLTSRSNTFHYHPLGIIWFCFPSTLFGFDPFWTHINSLIIHAVNAILVFVLAGLLLENKELAFGAAILFLTGIYVPETICWGGGFPNAGITLLFLTCFLLLRRSIVRKSTLSLVVYNTLFAASLFVFPTAINFLAVYALYLLFDPEMAFGSGGQRSYRSNFSRTARILWVSALCVLFFLVIRSFLVERATYHTLNPLEPGMVSGVIVRMFRALDILLIPSEFIRAFMPGGIMSMPRVYSTSAVIFLAGLIVIMLFKSSARDRFISLWVLTQIFLIAVETDVGSRHLYAASTGAAILFMRALHKAIGGVAAFVEQELQQHSSLLKRLPASTRERCTLLLLLGILFVPVKNNLLNVRYFMGSQEKASEIVRSCTEYVQSARLHPSQTERIYLINFPYAICRAGGLSSFVLPYDDFLRILDLQEGAEVWRKNYSLGTCSQLYVLPESQWIFLKPQHEHHQKIPDYSVNELRHLASQPSLVMVFDYIHERPITLEPMPKSNPPMR